MPLRAGPPPDYGQLGQMGQQAPPQVPGLLQMAQAAMGDGGDVRSGGGGGLPMAAWMDKSNWGPAPDPTGPMSATPSGWFPDVFQHGQNPNGKFWSMKDYMTKYYNKYGGQPPEGGFQDDRPNTNNSQMLANYGRPNEPGAFMYLGHHISPGQMIQDLQQGQNPPAGAEGGGNRPPIRKGIQRYGSEFSAAFPYGGVTMLGLPGQLENWATGY